MTIFYERACDLFGDMRQQQIADMTGLAQGKVSDILSQGRHGSNPNKKPSAETVYKIAKAFNVSTDYLLGLTDIKTVGNEPRIAYSEGYNTLVSRVIGPTLMLLLMLTLTPTA